MSNYHALARHPITGEIRVADWLDDSFGHHIYGVHFPGDATIYRSAQCNEVSLHEAGVEIERLRGIIAHNDAALAEVCAENERLWAALEEIADYDAYGWTLQTELAYAALGEEKPND